MKRVITVMIVMAFVLAAVSQVSAVAQEAQKTAQSDDYARNVLTGSVETVGEAAKGTTETAVSPIVAFWRSITGRGKPEKVVTDPVEKGGKTVYDATVNTGKTIAGEKR